MVYQPATTKRYFDLHTQFSPDQPMPEKELPAITYASPDYRPLPRTDALWLQPVNATSPMTEDDSNDEDESLLTPMYQAEKNASNKPREYWNDMVVDQWQ